jgi:hypothetical protein
MSYDDVNKMKQFGVVTLEVCNIDLTQFINGESMLPEDANSFFELYIQD